MKTILILLIAAMTQIAHSKTIFEPSLSFGQGTGALSGLLITNDTPSDAKGTVGSLGVRYGITRRYIHVTAMLEGHFLSSKQADKDFVGYLGLGIGYEWNIPLRTYLMMGAYDFDTDFMGGGAEVSYLFNDSFWIGIRYSNLKTSFSQTVLNTAFETKVSLSTYMLTVSFPFEFNYPDHWFRKTDWE